MINDTYASRAAVLKKMRDLIDQVDAEGRNLTTEESEIYDRMEAEHGGFTKTIERHTKQLALENSMAQPLAEPVLSQPGAEPSAVSDRPPVEAILEAYGAALSHGIPELSGALPFTAEHKKVLNALEQGTDTAGGYLVPPQEFVAMLIRKIDDLVFIRMLATKFTLTTAKTLGIPSLDADPSDADWTQEVGTVQEDTAMTFGKRELSPYLLSKLIKVSMRLLDTGAIPVESLVIDRLAFKFGVTEEKAYLTGSGANRPLGLFTQSVDGISSARNVNEDMAVNAITADGLINVKYFLKGQYWQNAQWLFHRDAMKQIAKLKDTQERYLFLESLRADTPDLLLGRPLIMSEFVPNTFTTGLFVGMFADFSKYWIVDALSMTMQRLVEKYAETNQVGFIGRKETDGMPVLEEAFVRVTLA